jgi:hypothetical protein
VVGLLVLGGACGSALLEEVTRERKASNLDVGGFEALGTGVDAYGCVKKGEINDCISLIVKGLREYQNKADNTKVPPEVVPTKKSKYP